MLAALGGFAIIWTIIAVGWLLAQLSILDAHGRVLLNQLAFLVASPALLFSIVSKASLARLFSNTLIASVGAIAVTAGLYLLANALVFKHSLGGATIGWLVAAYTNAGNLGLPVAQHVLGDITWMAPILLVQVAFLQPFALASLDAVSARARGVRLSTGAALSLPVRNPITVGILLGLMVNLTHVTLPAWLGTAVDMVGGMAVPMMLLAFGVSLRRDPLPGSGPHAREVWLLEALKLVVMPGIALAAGSALGLDRHQLLAVGVIAALPTAQNIYVIASRYGQSVPVARDGVFWSTIGSVPVILGLVAFLG